MADKKAPAAEEKIFTIPLRKAFTPASRIERTKKSVSAVKGYIRRHAHAPEVKVSEKLNDMLWASGAKKPLHSVKVKVSVSEGVADARLPEEITLEEEKKKFLEKETKKAEEKAKERLPDEGAAEGKKEAKPEESKTEKSPEEKK
jgi:ribosomal protein L31E